MSEPSSQDQAVAVRSRPDPARTDPRDLVDQADVVGRVAWRVDDLHRAVPELDDVAIDQQLGRRRRVDAPVQLVEPGARPRAHRLVGTDQELALAIELAQALPAVHPGGQLAIPVQVLLACPARSTPGRARACGLVEKLVAADVIEWTCELTTVTGAAETDAIAASMSAIPRPVSSRTERSRAGNQPGVHVSGLGDDVQPGLHRRDMEPLARVRGEPAVGHGATLAARRGVGPPSPNRPPVWRCRTAACAGWLSQTAGIESRVQ